MARLTSPAAGQSGPGRARLDRRPLLVLPAGAYLLAAFAAPLLIMFANSFFVSGEISLANYRHVLLTPEGLRAIGATLRYGMLVTASCLVLGVPAAFAMHKLERRAQKWILYALLIPVSTSVVVKVLGWTILLRRDGVINRGLMALHVTQHPIALLFTELGLVLATTGLMLPFMVLPVFNAIQKLPLQTLDAAATLGAGWFYRMRRVALPLVLPGIAAGAAIVFSHTTAAYLIPTFLGGGSFSDLSTSLVNDYVSYQNAAQGAAFSVVLLLIIGVVLALTNGGGRSRPSRSSMP